MDIRNKTKVQNLIKEYNELERAEAVINGYSPYVVVRCGNTDVTLDDRDIVSAVAKVVKDRKDQITESLKDL